MERSRSKRSYHHYDQDSDSQTPPPPRTKPRYDGGGHHRRSSHYRRGGDRRPPPPPQPPPSASSSKAQDGSPPPGAAVSTFFRILCPDAKAGSVIGKSGSIIKTFRQETGAWIDVHQLVPGDEERIIETSDTRRREADGRPPQYSPAQEALLLIHERIVDAELEFGEDEEEEEYGGGWGAGGDRNRDRGRMTTRLVVPRSHVGCLMGKGGKIIEHMRMETKTHIRILPRDQYTPRCVSASEEIVQVFGEGNAVKKAVAVISSRLKESLHRDRGPFRGRIQSPERYFPPDDEFMNNGQQWSALEGPDSGSRPFVGPARVRKNAYGSTTSEYSFDSNADPMTDLSQSFPYEDIVFRILCPNDKVESVIGLSDGIIEMLRTVVGVDVSVTDPVPSSEERIIIVTSDEGPDDDLFPAQEALLHIQTRIVDLGPDKDNIITTRLLVPSSDIGCLEGRDGSLSDLGRLTSTNVQILPKEALPPCALEADELIQIVGEIRAARNALLQITEKLRSYLYRDISITKDFLPLPISAASHVDSITALESNSPIKSLPHDGFQGSNRPMAVYQNMHTVAATHSKMPILLLKRTIQWLPLRRCTHLHHRVSIADFDSGGVASGSLEQEESNASDAGRQSAPKRFSAPFVTKSTLEVVIPKYAVPSLIMRSGSKLAQISEMSGATVTLIEDQPEQAEKVVQISGSPEQSERAQSLLQGFILSTQDDIPSS